MKKISIAAILLLIASAVRADPIKIMKSQVAPTFAADVARYAQEMTDWKSHMARVQADKAAGVPKQKAFAPYPAPVADPTVAGAIDANGKPNFQIVDDGPTPDQVVAAKKAALITQVRMAEQEAVARIVPPFKRRAFDSARTT